MLKKPITFKNLEGEPITRDFYFNLSSAEILEMMVDPDGGLQEYLQRIIDSNNNREIVALLKKIITTSLGRKAENGIQFVKKQEYIDEFLQSDAYSVLLMEFFTDPGAAAIFAAGVVPAEAQEEVRATLAARSTETVQLPAEETPAWVRENRDPTPAELQSMTKEQLTEAFARKNAS